MPRILVGNGVQRNIIINDLPWVVTCDVTCDVPIAITISCAPFWIRQWGKNQSRSFYTNWISWNVAFLKYQVNHDSFFQFIMKVHSWSIAVSTFFFACMSYIVWHSSSLCVEYITCCNLNIGLMTKAKAM